MTKPKKKTELTKGEETIAGYDDFLKDIIELFDHARRISARAVNSVMTATYWEVGRRIVLKEQGGKRKADYGKQIVDNLVRDLTAQFERGFGRSNLFQMRSFYLAYPQIVQTPSGQSSKKVQTMSGQSDLASLAKRFPLPLVALRQAARREKRYGSCVLRNGNVARWLDSAAT